MIINGREIDGSILSDYNMCDIHMHVIHEVDDGAWNMEMALDMLFMSITQGIRKIICTSHSFAFDWKANTVIENFEQLKKTAQQLYPEVELFLGCEVACHQKNMDNVLERLLVLKYPTMCDTRYVLTEFYTTISVEEVLYCVERLQEAGWIPVIAHIERYKGLFQDKLFIKQLKERGCLIQINVYSIKEEEDEDIKENARYMLDKKWVDFLGSDAHTTHHRPPKVEAGLEYLYENYDKEYVDQIVYHNAIKYFGI